MCHLNVPVGSALLWSMPSVVHLEASHHCDTTTSDTTACLLSEVCHNVALEPSLMPLSGERLRHKTANTEDGARLDIQAKGFWGERHQSAFFDVRVFNPFAPSNTNSTPESVYKRHENEMRRNYEEGVREVEHGSFTPLVFSATGGMGKAATVMYQ